MKILFVNQAYYPDKVASASYLTEFAEYLAEKKHEVTVLTSRFEYGNPIIMYPKSEMINGVRVIRSGLNPLFMGGRAARVVNALFMNLSFAWNLIRIRKYEQVIAMTSPPLIGFVALICTYFKRGKFIYWLLDINPDQAIQAGWLLENSLRTKILKHAFGFTLRKSDLIIVLDKYMKKKIAEKKIPEGKIRICSLWGNSVKAQECGIQSEIKKKMNLENKFVVLYAGNHSICHPLDTLLMCAERMRNNSEVAFVFIGRGERVRDVSSFKDKYGLRNIYQFDYRNSWEESLYLADLHTVIMGDEYSGVVHPCKIYNILSTEKPFLFIGGAQTHISDMIEKYGVGARVSHRDVQSAVVFINQIIKKSNKQDEQRSRIYQSIRDDLSPNKKMYEMEKSISGE